MSTYEEDVAIVLRERRASTCTCGATNPPHYDACHDCGQPLVTCATCGIVSPQRYGGCTGCRCETDWGLAWNKPGPASVGIDTPPGI